MLVREIAQALGAPFEGDGERTIASVAAVESAGADQISFVGGKKIRDSAAGCLLVNADYPSRRGVTVIRVRDPRAAFARVVAMVHPERTVQPSIHPTAVVGPGSRIGDGVSIGPHAVIGEDAEMGAGTVVGAGSVIGRKVKLGECCRVHANVTIYDNVTVGARAILHSGCILGADGFGFVPVDGRWEKFPQIGTVTLGDDVEIGANSCVDRGALGATTIGDGTKLDNMVHVGHNCAIGRHVVVAAQTGFSGGVVVEDYAVIGGQVGIGDKARIESGAVLGSGCGVLTSKIVRAGEPLWGTPARPLKQYLRTLAEQARLPEYRDRLRELELRIRELEGRGGEG